MFITSKFHNQNNKDNNKNKPIKFTNEGFNYEKENHDQDRIRDEQTVKMLGFWDEDHIKEKCIINLTYNLYNLYSTIFSN